MEQIIIIKTESWKEYEELCSRLEKLNYGVWKGHKSEWKGISRLYLEDKQLKADREYPPEFGDLVFNYSDLKKNDYKIVIQL